MCEAYLKFCTMFRYMVRKRLKDSDIMVDWSEKSANSFLTMFVEAEIVRDNACNLVRSDLHFCGRNRRLQD